MLEFHRVLGRVVKMVSKSQLLVFLFAFLMIFVLVNFIIVAVRKFQKELPRVERPKRGCPEKVLFNHTLSPHTSLIYDKTYKKFLGLGAIFRLFSIDTINMKPT